MLMHVGDSRSMNGGETLNGAPRGAAQEFDSQAWRATLAAAQRVLGYYASRAQPGAASRSGADAATAAKPASRLPSRSSR